MGTEEGYHPEAIALVVQHGAGVTPAKLAGEYARALAAAGRGEVVGYSVPGKNTDVRRGSRADVEAALLKLGGEKGHAFVLVTADDTKLVASRDAAWDVTVKSLPDVPPTAGWMQGMAGLARAAVQLPGFEFAALNRRQVGWVSFVPEPPLARTNHVVTATDAEVAERYDDPDRFWSAWERVERIGDVRLCIRALAAIDDHSWLGSTFESSMALARAARPDSTRYNKPKWHEGFRAWWEYGDHDDEKSGHPALSLVGRDKTGTVEYTGLIVRKPLEAGGSEPRHVHIREIHDLRALVKAGKDGQGRPVTAVRIVFPEEWMARQERRPLLDAGAQVYFMDRKTGTLVAVTD